MKGHVNNNTHTQYESSGEKVMPMIKVIQKYFKLQG